jgi:cob(I)alamin adenosyltransferase
MKIYTKQGDAGQTALYGGRKVSKSDLQIEAYGTIDELNSNIGFLAAHVDDKSILDLLLKCQQDLFVNRIPPSH